MGQVHTISENGTYSMALLGLPVGCGNRDAKPHVVVPRSAYATYETASKDTFSLHSYLDVPGE